MARLARLLGAWLKPLPGHADRIQGWVAVAAAAVPAVVGWLTSIWGLAIVGLVWLLALALLALYRQIPPPCPLRPFVHPEGGWEKFGGVDGKPGRADYRIHVENTSKHVIRGCEGLLIGVETERPEGGFVDQAVLRIATRLKWRGTKKGRIAMEHDGSNSLVVLRVVQGASVAQVVPNDADAEGYPVLTAGVHRLTVRVRAKVTDHADVRFIVRFNGDWEGLQLEDVSP